MILIALAALACALAYFGLLIFALYQLRRPTTTGYWLAGFSGGSVLFALTLVVDGFNLHLLGFAPGLWLAIAILGNLCVLGALTFSYLNLKWSWLWLPGMFPLIGVILIIDIVDPNPGLTELTWRTALSGLSVSAITGAVAWGLLGLILLVITFNETSKARLPLHANRGLWWGIMLPAFMVAEGLAVWGPDVISAIGQVLRVLALLGLAYGATSQNLIDVRGLFRGVLGNALFVVVTALVSLAGIVAAVYVFENYPGRGWTPVILIALVLALVYQALRSFLDRIIKNTVLKSGYDTAAIAAEYSKSIAQILDVNELTATIGQALAQSVEATKLGILDLAFARDSIRVDVYAGSGNMPNVGHRFPANSPFFEQLIRSRKPLLQYTIDVGDQFRNLLPIDRRWLQRLGCDVYAPILDGETVIGILAVGPRKSRDPYRARDLDLLQAIADQTAVALANARLVTDLKASNEEVRALNETLAETNEQLKEMDRVKTDFITIASHELRTPLTQILGYADLLSMMSEAETIAGSEISPITGSVLKAGNRLNEIVGQMLEVSQLDVAAIELNMEDTSMDAALQIAAEPFEDALRERHLVLTANNVRTLPGLRADRQRLGQALRQIIGNAIKFTPDGGHIEVRGRHLREKGEAEAIEICVADTGVGIDAKHLELIFEKFFRVGSTTTHSTGATKFMGAGPGLGLAIAKGVILAHGGKIWAASPGFDPERFPGAQIYIQLPLKPSAPPPAPESNGKAASANT
jgi:signal transduction histidine kinase